jgi:hypothetical protein
MACIQKVNLVSFNSSVVDWIRAFSGKDYLKIFWVGLAKTAWIRVKYKC